VLVVGVSDAIAIDGVAKIPILVAAVAMDVLIVVLLVRVPQPSSLTALSARTGEQTWPTTAAVGVLPGVLERNPGLRDTAQLIGTVSLSPSGIRWDPSPRSERFAGPSTVTWDPSWVPYARRLRGLGGLVQLTLASPTGAPPVTLWLRRASAFQIP
jgi:hypothetical protein